MQRDAALKVISEHRPELQAHGVRSLMLFGSVARGEAKPESDVDLIVEFDRQVGLFELARLKFALEQWLACPVDLVTLDSIPERSRPHILGEALRAA